MLGAWLKFPLMAEIIEELLSLRPLYIKAYLNINMNARVVLTINISLTARSELFFGVVTPYLWVNWGFL